MDLKFIFLDSDEGSGKSTLCKTVCAQQSGAPQYDETNMNFAFVTVVDGQPINVSFWDTKGGSKSIEFRIFGIITQLT
jgi:hypothetical protein